MVDLQTIKNLKKLTPYSKEVFSNFISAHTNGIEDSFTKIQTIVNEVELTIFDTMKSEDILESAILIAVQNIQNDIDYETIATRLAVSKIYSTALIDYENQDDFNKVYQESFKKYIHKAISDKLVDDRMGELFDLNDLSSVLTPSQDDIYKYIGITTLENRYMIKDRNQFSMETPQYTYMRVAMGLSLKEKDPTQQAKIFYKKLSTIEYVPGGSTMIGSGTTYPVLSNCYLIDTEDNIESIFDNVKNVALISKATGGIGISVTKLRASGSPVKSNNTFSTGPIPFIKVMDTALKSVSRAGKKAGAMAIYMENWHIDFHDFLDLKQNAGDDYRRIRTADTAVYISDEFMKRVINNEEWYMFDPLEVRELTELYGEEFSKKYNEYIQKAKNKEMKMFNVIPAREQMERILNTLLSTSHPWLTWKDTINLRALNNNTGTIHCSNLCTEVCLPQDKDNIAVCNLLYANLTNHIIKTNNKTDIDWSKLKETVKIGMRHLDNLIDVNMPNVPQADHSDKANRAVGLGIMGLAEVLELFGYAYDDEKAFELTDKIIEFVSYVTIDESCKLAEERGSYPNYEGSMWSKGFVPYDTIQKVADSREQYLNKNNSNTESLNTSNLEEIKKKINMGLRDSNSSNNQELKEIFDKLTQYISKVESTPIEQPDKKELLKQNRDKKLDWDKLREKVKKGIRNATTMMIAPNASSGLVAGTSPGVDPRFSQIFSRSTSNGKFLDINHNLVKDLKKLNLWEKVKDQVLANYGDLSEIDEIPENLKNIYKTSFQIAAYASIEIASRAQKWIDQSISRNMYLETREIDELVEIYTEAWRRGLKTTYYLHTKPRHKAEQSTVKINKGKALNMKGFGQIDSPTTSQISFEGKDVKGFGFVRTTIDSSEQQQESPILNKTTQEEKITNVEMQSSTIQSTVIKKEENLIDSKIQIGQACPVDPMERALCEGCQ